MYVVVSIKYKVTEGVILIHKNFNSTHFEACDYINTWYWCYGTVIQSFFGWLYLLHPTVNKQRCTNMHLNTERTLPFENFSDRYTNLDMKHVAHYPSLTPMFSFSSDSLKVCDASCTFRRYFLRFFNTLGFDPISLLQIHLH